ncbi:MAG: enoyl-CoA hydratase-related protein [Pelagimonas sp.]|jgi:enoyl-CoA hydratase|nr:enoyl-CoA hydratase-related protein [Pelagimonas sp.]
MGYHTIKTEVTGRVATIRFDRPEALNALNSQVMQEVLQAATGFDSDPGIGAIVLTGNDRAFAAGADIKELMQHDYASMYAEDYFAPWDRFAALRTPKIAVVRGYALGGGCEVAMMCDLLLASDTARFGQPEVKIGCIPGIGGTQRLTRLIGKAAAMDLILTGRMIDAHEALRLGLTSRVIADDQIIEQAMETAQRIASYAKDITMMARACVLEADQGSLDAGVRYERQMYHALYGSEAQVEGMTAFVEKRKPAFNR